MEQFDLLYIPVGSQIEASTLARTLIVERLIGCANIFSPVTSIYRDHGEIKEVPEVILIAKTTRKKTDSVITRVKDLHPYECPCIIALPVTTGHPDYLQWLQEAIV